MNNELKTKNMQFVIKSKDSTTGEFEGWASVYNVIDYHNEIMSFGCFAESLDRIKSGKDQTPLMLWSHDQWSPPIGIWKEFIDSKDGLYAKGRIFETADPLIKQGISEGVINGLSIGFIPQKSEYDDETGIITWTKAELKETSLCNFGANPEAVITQIKSGEKITKRDLEKILRDSGYSKSQAQIIISAYDPNNSPLRDLEREKILAGIRKNIKRSKYNAGN